VIEQHLREIARIRGPGVRFDPVLRGTACGLICEAPQRVRRIAAELLVIALARALAERLDVFGTIAIPGLSAP